jgi:hypothetical protein
MGILPLKSLWEPIIMIRPEIINFTPTFWMPAYSVVSFSATEEKLKQFIGGRQESVD